MPLKIPSHQLGNERNSSIQKQLTSQGFRLTGKPLLRNSGQAEETGCPGPAGLGKEPTVAVCILGRQQCCTQPLRRGDDGVVQSLGEQKRVGTHPTGHYFWANAWVGLNWSRMSTQLCPS